MKEYLGMNMEEVAAQLNSIPSNSFSNTILLLKIAQFLEKIAYEYELKGE